MRLMRLLGVIAGIAAPAFAQTPAAESEALVHVRTAFDLTVRASYAETAPLFGAEGERAWAGKHWKPEFIYPLPARDVEGAVFTIHHGPMTAVWVNTLLDLDARHFQYVYFLPDVMVTVIDVRFKSIDANTTGVNVVYARTAITPQGNEHVAAMSEGDKTAGQEWQQAIDAYLAGRKQDSKP